MSSIRYNYSGVDEPSFDESLNHPSFIKTHDSPSVSCVSSRSNSLARSTNRSPQVTGIRHPSFIHDEQHPHATEHSTDDASLGWSFQYDDFEQELLEDTSPPQSVSGNILSSPKSTGINQVPTAVTETSSTTPPMKDASAFLFDNDYSQETRERIERSFNEQFGLQSSSSHHHSTISHHSSNSQLVPRHMTDMMENKSLQMQESLCSRIQMLEDKLKNIQLETTLSSQRSESVVSRETDTSSTSNDIDTNNLEQKQRMMDLQHFVDRVDALVWNTPFLSPAETIQSAHVCDRHQAWSKHVLREQQKTALDSLDAHDRMEATLQQLMYWSDSIRNDR